MITGKNVKILHYKKTPVFHGKVLPGLYGPAQEIKNRV
jgi:hypothetical protein